MKMYNINFLPKEERCRWCIQSSFYLYTRIIYDKHNIGQWIEMLKDRKLYVPRSGKKDNKEISLKRVSQKKLKSLRSKNIFLVTGVGKLFFVFIVYIQLKWLFCTQSIRGGSVNECHGNIWVNNTYYVPTICVIW